MIMLRSTEITEAENIEEIYLMTPDFTPFLMSGEQLMWQGQSHKDGPPANPASTRSTRMFGIIWTVITALLFGFIIFQTIGDSKMNGKAWAAIIGCAVLFVGVGIGLIISTFHYKQEYYCITDKRFLVMTEKGVIDKSGELSHILSAELTAIKNGYGSIIMKTDLVHYTHSNGRSHSHRTYWTMRAIEEPAECYRLLTGILQINDEYRFV